MILSILGIYAACVHTWVLISDFSGHIFGTPKIFLFVKLSCYQQILIIVLALISQKNML